MIEWRYKTPRRRMTVRYGYVGDECVYTIEAEKFGGPWSLFAYDEEHIGTYNTVAQAKACAEHFERVE